MPLEPEEEREASSVPSTTGGGGTSVEPELVAEESPEASKSPSVKSKSPPESSSSPSPDSDLELGALQHMTYKSKDLPMPLSPDRIRSVKRRLWEVDRREVDESLTRELKRIRQEESLVKSSKWNFDFEEERPLSGAWEWEKTESPPDFYKTKDCPKKKTTQSRFSPYERSSSFSQSVSSSSLPHTSSVSLVTSSRELTTLRSAVSSSVSTPEASTKECVESSSSVHISSEASEVADVAQGSKVLPTSSPTTHSTSLATTSDPDIYSPDYFKPPNLLIEQCLRVEDIPKTPSSVSSSSTSIASSSSASVSNNGSSCVSSSSGSKNNTEDSSKYSCSSELELATCSKNSSSSSELEASKTSSSDHGIIPSCFYSSETVDTKQKSKRGADSSTITKSSGSSVKAQEKKKIKPPKPSSSEESSPSHLLKYYR